MHNQCTANFISLVSMTLHLSPLFTLLLCLHWVNGGILCKHRSLLMNLTSKFWPQHMHYESALLISRHTFVSLWLQASYDNMSTCPQAFQLGQVIYWVMFLCSGITLQYCANPNVPCAFCWYVVAAPCCGFYPVAPAALYSPIQRCLPVCAAL